VGRGRDAEVEFVVPAVEQRRFAGQVSLAAGFRRRLDRPQLAGGGPGRRQPAGGRLLDAAELEQHVDVLEVRRQEQAAPVRRAEHPFVVGDVQAPPLLDAHPADRGEDLHRLADHGA
jgi:hypothetical protein